MQALFLWSRDALSGGTKSAVSIFGRKRNAVGI